MKGNAGEQWCSAAKVPGKKKNRDCNYIQTPTYLYFGCTSPQKTEHETCNLQSHYFMLCGGEIRNMISVGLQC